MESFRVIAEDLAFPEGPLELPGGDLALVEIRAGTVTRVALDGRKSIIAKTGGGPNGIPLKGPNDLVFDAEGNFYVTDLGTTRPRDRDRTGVFYASPDGKMIKEIVFPMEAPNGVGLSPDGKVLYVAESTTSRVWAFPARGPGPDLRTQSSCDGARRAADEHGGARLALRRR